MADPLDHFLALLRRKDYGGARAYAEGFPEGEKERLLKGLDLLERAPEALEDPLFAAEKEVVLGVKAVREGRREEAEARFQKALTLDPLHHRALTNLGSLHLERGEEEAALDLYGKALRLAPDDPLLHENLAALYKRRGDLDKMVAHMKRATRLRMTPPAPLDPLTGERKRSIRIPLWALFLLLALLAYLFLYRP
ncbi:tetratricopeptide repeat protein [Thermus sediminis]|uniref:tetratricopeptide repeat protein n=1 Tax=Thermus sediminis TaxID=1761908 RepID=UPI000E3CBC39|nr:tetratricopeptide repeat protein [Thermus sediminis]